MASVPGDIACSSSFATKSFTCWKFVTARVGHYNLASCDHRIEGCMTTHLRFPIIPRPYAKLQLRHHRDRRRAGRICGGDSRGAAQEARALHREGKSRRDVSELGMHPDQGAV